MIRAIERSVTHRLRAMALFVLLVATTMLLAAAAFGANPVLTAGGSAVSFPSTGTGTLSGVTWQVSLAGTTVGSSTTSNGWTASYNTGSATFTVGAPATAAAATSYLVVYDTGAAQPSANFDVVPALSAFTINPATVIGATSNGTVSQGTVTLSEPAGPGGVVVSLQSNNPIVNMPASVTIAQGNSSNTFSITTNSVAVTTVIQLTATLNGTSINQNLTANPWLATVTSSPTSSVGGQAPVPSGTVTLNAPAPTGGIVVNLTSSNTSALTVPATVTVPAGSTTANFTITTLVVATSTSVTISAQYDLTTVTATQTVLPVISTLTLNPTTVVGPASSTATVTLNIPAPTGGITLTLSSSDTSAATVPASLVIAAGSTSNTFTVSTITQTLPKTPGISAKYTSGAVNQTVTQTLYVDPLLQSVTLNPSTLTGGASSAGTVTLYGPAPAGGINVTVTSSNTSVATIVSSPVNIAAGATSGSFTVPTVAGTSVNNVTIQAVYGGATRTATLTVNPLTITVTLNPATVVGGYGNTSAGTITLNSNAPSNIVVALSSNNAAATLSPTSVTVLTGTNTASFTVNTNTVTTNTNATITGSYGTVSGTAVLTVKPLLLSYVLSPTSLVGGYGNTSTGTITLNGPAPAGGISVPLTNTNTTAATVPSTVAIAAGQSSGTFTVTTNTVTTNSSATITAAFGGVSIPQTLTVLPMLASLTLNPTSIFGGGTSTGTVSLNGPAPSGGITVTLTNGNTAIATVPTSIAIAAGASSGQFSITTVSVTSVQTAVITASFGGVSSAKTLTVTPILSSISLNPTSVIAGQSVTGTITLYGAAPAGGVSIALTSNNTAAATISTSPITVPAGSSTASFTVNTLLVTASTSVTISAADGTSTRTAALTVYPLLSSIRLNYTPTSYDVVGGDTVPNCSVVFSLASPTAVTIPVTSSNTGIANPTPTSISVTAGASSAAFTVPTVAVSSTTTATISSTYNGVTVSAALRVHPVPTVASVTLSTSPVIGGNSVTGTVHLSDIAPASGAVVALSSGNTVVASVPASVTVASGATTATFTITTYPTAASTAAVITGTYNSSNANVSLTVNRPSLTGLSISPNSVVGGTGTTGTLTINGKAPSGGVVINITCSPANAASLPATVTFPTNATTTTFPIATSTVTAPLVLPITATNSVASSETFTTNISLTLSILRSTDITIPKAIILQWSTPATGNYILARDGVQIASLSNSTTTYTDVFTWNTGQTYQYDLYDTSISGTLLGTERCQPYQVAAIQDQAVDSRLDPRYPATPGTLLDHCFGSASYNGGLFAGYASDPAKVGRSFATFGPWTYPSNAIYRGGKLCAYLVAGDIHGTGSITEQVGAQTISNTTWDPTTLKWSTAPPITPASAPYTASVTYNPTASPTVTPVWKFWGMTNEINSAITNSQTLGVAWASMNEAAQGWVYFAKTEFSPAYGPCAIHLWSLPTLINLNVPTPVSYNGGAGSATGTLTVNAVGLQGSANVTLSSSNPAVATVPSTWNVTGLTRTFPITLTGTGTVTISATYNGVTKTATMVVNP